MNNEINLIKAEKFSASIYVGLKVQNTGEIHSITAVENICQKFCDDIGFCVTVTPTKYVYTDGWEQGAIVGIINYPRFPASEQTLENRALLLATELMLGLEQKRVTIDSPNGTTMLTNPNI